MSWWQKVRVFGAQIILLVFTTIEIGFWAWLSDKHSFLVYPIGLFTSCMGVVLLITTFSKACIIGESVEGWQRYAKQECKHCKYLTKENKELSQALINME